MKNAGLFITFEGTEGSGKSTQIALLADRLRALGHTVRLLREPGGTPIGEEIRHTLKHSEHNRAMTAEAELLLMNASRAQLTREIIGPALAAGEVVVCDRFYDSTTAYQGYGRGLSLKLVQSVIDFAVGDIHPHLTLLLAIPLGLSEARRSNRLSQSIPIRDRFEEADREFYVRVEHGYREIAASHPRRVKWIDATADVPTVSGQVWRWVEPMIKDS